MPAQGRNGTLKKGLDRLYSLFDRSFISPDPLECVPADGTREDRELAAFLAATFAYGRADLIVKTVRGILDELGPHPHHTLLHERYGKRFKGFKYRFHKKPDLVWLLGRLEKLYREHGNLEEAFINSGHNHIERMDGFSKKFSQGRKLSQAKSFLVPSPASGAACKRLNLFIRWMVRNDELDLGLWHKVKPSEIIIPLDVHVHRIAIRIGLASPGPATFKKAMELTGTLRLIDPDDPVKYDFAICSLGKLGHCEKSPNPAKCYQCLLNDFCTERPE